MDDERFSFHKYLSHDSVATDGCPCWSCLHAIPRPTSVRMPLAYTANQCAVAPTRTRWVCNGFTSSPYCNVVEKLLDIFTYGSSL